MTKDNLWKIGKSVLIAAGAGAGAYVAANYTAWDFGKDTILVQGIISVLIVAVKEYLKSRSSRLADVTISGLPDVK